MIAAGISPPRVTDTIPVQGRCQAGGGREAWCPVAVFPSSQKEFCRARPQGLYVYQQ